MYLLCSNIFGVCFGIKQERQKKTMGSKNVLSNAVILESQVTLLSIYETLLNVNSLQSHLLKIPVLKAICYIFKLTLTIG